LAYAIFAVGAVFVLKLTPPVQNLHCWQQKCYNSVNKDRSFAKNIRLELTK